MARKSTKNGRTVYVPSCCPHKWFSSPSRARACEAKHKRARKNPSRVGAIRSYAIMDDDHSKWGSKKKYANWTTYPTYSYEMFYRANPAKGAPVGKVFFEVVHGTGGAAKIREISWAEIGRTSEPATRMGKVRIDGVPFVYAGGETRTLYGVKATSPAKKKRALEALEDHFYRLDDQSSWDRGEDRLRRGPDPGFVVHDNPANGSDPVAALMEQLRERRAYYDAAYRGAAPEFVLADLRREIHEIEQRLEAVIDAQRGGHVGHAIGNRRKSARKKSAKARKAGRLLPVPERMKMTPRAHAEGISAIGVPGKWPIGDLPHARLALVYALSPSHKKVRRKVLNAVAANYPEYNWAGWWNKKARGKAGVKSWATYVTGASKHRAAANPKARKNFFWGGKAAAPETDTFTVRYEVWVDRMPRKGSKKFTREGLAAWYHGTLADPKVDGVRVKSASGISMKEIADILGVKQSALNNPKKSKVNYGLKIGRSRPDEMPANTGPYLPQMYPYGRGGRPATYYK